MMRVRMLLGALCMAALALVSGSAQAKPAYAQKEGQKCVYCHVVPGGERNFRGLYYAAKERSFEYFDNVYEAKRAGVPADSMGADARPKVKTYPANDDAAPALDFVLKDIDGKPVKLARYQGEVILAVNVASKCGLTPQYEKLQALYKKYKEKGFVILAFPANDFGMQEPGTEKEIKEFCTSKYSVTFPMFSKIVVKGKEMHPFYKFLTSEKTNPKFAGPIQWNFAKFLINRKGEVVNRFDPQIAPDSADLIAAIEKELQASKNSQ